VVTYGHCHMGVLGARPGVEYSAIDHSAIELRVLELPDCDDSLSIASAASKSVASESDAAAQ
jgi:hypothetical protein